MLLECAPKKKLVLKKIATCFPLHELLNRSIHDVWNTGVARNPPAETVNPA